MLQCPCFVFYRSFPVAQNITYRTLSFDFRLETAIPLLLREIKTLSKENAISIAFPDEGAFKRFHTMFTSFEFPTITCTKIRDGNKRIVRVKDGKFYDVSLSFGYLPNSLIKSGTWDFHICSAFRAAAPNSLHDCHCAVEPIPLYILCIPFPDMVLYIYKWCIF